MYLSEKSQPPIDFYKDEADRDMMLEVTTDDDLPPPHHHHIPPPPMATQQTQLILCDSSGGEDQELNNNNNNHNSNNHRAPKKRAETWVHDETRILIGFRREMDGLFNTSKSNKHLWEQISAKMREKGFDRAPSMCTEKWRNLLKDFKKAKQREKVSSSGGESAKMSYYKEIDEILKVRNKSVQYKSPTPTAKIDPFIQFSDKGFEDPGISFGPVEASSRQTLNLERRMEHDGPPLSISAAEASEVPPWNWRETPGSGGEGQSYCGRVINVKCGDYVRRIGIDGSADAIKEAIRCAFRIRTKRAFWLEDEDQIVRCLDRDMPLGNYNLQVDEGMAIKVCLYDDSDHMPVHTEDKVFYTEDDYREFLARREWTCLREFDGFRNIENMDDFRPGAIYRGVS